MRQKIRFKHYSIRTEQAYVDWARRYVLFHGKRHPRMSAQASHAETLMRAIGGTACLLAR